MLKVIFRCGYGNKVLIQAIRVCLYVRLCVLSVVCMPVYLAIMLCHLLVGDPWELGHRRPCQVHN